MGISALLCLAVLGIGLDVKIPLITKCGSRTLQVYFWHRTIVYMLTYYGYQAYLAKAFPETLGALSGTYSDTYCIGALHKNIWCASGYGA